MSSLLEYFRKNTDENGNIVFSRVKEEDITICGKTIEEVITILNGLEIERITDIQVTMKNLSKLGEKMQQDFQNSLDKSMERIIFKDCTGITTSGVIKMNREENFKWKCDICGNGFNNFHAQGFDNRIYCPLCYFKHEVNQYKNAWEELKEGIEINMDYYDSSKFKELVSLNHIEELEQKYNIGGVKN